MGAGEGAEVNGGSIEKGGRCGKEVFQRSRAFAPFQT